MGDESRLGAPGEFAVGAEPVASAATAESAEPVASAATVAEDAGVGAPASGEVLAGPANAAEGYRAVADEHVQTLKSFWKNFLVSGLFVVAAVVIILACLAWFLNNSQVKANGANVSAAGLRYTIASSVDEGEQSHVGVYDGEMEKSEGTLSFDVTADSNFNNYNAGGLYPGARGVLSFTVTPIATDLKGVTIDISRILKTQDGAFIKGKDGALTSTRIDATTGIVSIAPATADETSLFNLAKGHLLFFTSKDDGGYYSNRVSDDKVVLRASDFYPKDSNGNATSEETTEPVTVSLYWVWPEYFQSYVLGGNTGYYKNLFVSAKLVDDEGKQTDYGKLCEYINDNPTQFFYGTTEDKTSVAAGPSMSSSDIAIGAALFNNADDKIGSEVSYMQLCITSNEMSASNSEGSGQ